MTTRANRKASTALPRTARSRDVRVQALPRHLHVADYPLLADLCWTGAVTKLVPQHAFAIYERNWRFVDLKRLQPRERALLDRLIHQFGGGVVNA